MDPIIILRTGSTAEPVQREYGDYDRWFIDAMRHHDLRFAVYDITRSPLPEMTRCLGIIVTGATSAAYRHEPWMDALHRFLRRAERIGPPVLCVCLSAQLLAQARGGDVVLNPAGWEIGAVRLNLTEQGRADPLFEGLAEEITVMATHEDRIQRLAPEAALLASNGAAPVQAFRAAARVWGVQFHPELTAGALRLLIELRRDSLMADVERHGQQDPGRHVDRLLEGLSERDEAAGRRILDNFVKVCRREDATIAAGV
ncbi:MAG: gamma-glutamyl-gamma-aminobutyrate hydrolase family protein [Acidobacteriota bacterium]